MANRTSKSKKIKQINKLLDEIERWGYIREEAIALVELGNIKLEKMVLLHFR